MRLFTRDRDPKVERLAKLSLFSDLTRDELKQIARVVDEVDVPGGRVLMQQGRPAWECFVVGGGTATVTIGDREVGTIEAGAVVGEMSMFGDGLRSATVTADSDMHLYVVDKRGFHALMENRRIAERITAEAERRTKVDAEAV